MKITLVKRIRTVIRMALKRKQYKSESVSSPLTRLKIHGEKSVVMEKIYGQLSRNLQCRETRRESNGKYFNAGILACASSVGSAVRRNKC